MRLFARDTIKSVCPILVSYGVAVNVILLDI